ncbi:DUF881 domain-containing protein [Radiobacillus kanasensis]|uniref:DUF881 domain-containing protein n=1 Tax=Radiobacillus kanasensis TaxID=2844358 RepID=UPI001E63796C|nr:DUF881 domain-containing protein [Radiobacillus kanasensis]UFU00947.1 DUF881 domain-containing protein [Radiobacillus kanasensis]
MKWKHKMIISVVCVITGILIAIQFKSVQEPKQRETRDLWEIRTQLQQEQKRQQQLLNQITKAETTIQQYQQQSEAEQIDTLKNSIEELNKQAGLTEVTGSGISILVNPLFEESSPNPQIYPTVTPELLNRLLNELNNYGATDVAIENERIVSVTPIRYVNGTTYVNNHPLPPVPIEIRILSKDPQRLLDYMEVSQARSEFAIENLELSISMEEELTLPAYEGELPLDFVKLLERLETGEE